MEVDINLILLTSVHGMFGDGYIFPAIIIIISIMILIFITLTCSPLYRCPSPSKRIPSYYRARHEEIGAGIVYTDITLPEGLILHNIPPEMKVGITDRIEVRISKKNLEEEIIKGLRGRGTPSLQNIKVGSQMEVRLTGKSFDIEPLSPNKLAVLGDFTQWEWDITPIKSGLQRMYLSVDAVIEILKISDRRLHIPVLEKEITVDVNHVYSIKRVIKIHWQLIISTLIGSGALLWVIKNIFLGKE